MAQTRHITCLLLLVLKAVGVESSPSAIYGHLSMPRDPALSLPQSHNTQSYSMRALKLCRPPSLHGKRYACSGAFDYEREAANDWVCVRVVRNKRRQLRARNRTKFQLASYRELHMLHLVLLELLCTHINYNIQLPSPSIHFRLPFLDCSLNISSNKFYH